MREFDTKKLLNICMAFSKEQDHSKLLEIILQEAMSITNCDAGTLYILEDNKLHFRVISTKSLHVYQGINDTSLLPSVEMTPENVCSYCAIEKTVLNISDVYNSTTFDFSGPKKYDAMTGYKTHSMLVSPMKDDKGNVIGVLQLMNALDDNNNVIPFDEVFALIILSLGAQAAICLSNINYAKESIEFLNSFVNVMTTAIDQRSPYNANHSKSMTQYADKFINWLNTTNNKWKFDETKKCQFLMSVQLHDIGKLVIPLEVMNKETRLSSRLNEVMNRLKIIELITKVEFLEKSTGTMFEKLTAKADTELIFAQIEEARNIIAKVNVAGYVPDDMINTITQIGGRYYVDTDRVRKKWLTDEELDCLLIQKGTLTSEERQTMESHVVLTEKMLKEMKFTKDYKDVIDWASSHHEFINGKGYPKQLSNEEICPEVRLLTILDVFDALTAIDRPYKPAMPADKAFGILENMVMDGQIDGDILMLFKQSNAYKLEV